MSCVGGRKKSLGPTAQSSSSSRRRSPHHSGVDVSDASRSITKLLRVDNTTKHGGVGTSYEINPTQSKQNDKNVFGLDPSYSKSNYYEIPHNDNNIRNKNISKSLNNEENNNRSGSTPASPQRTLQNDKQILLPSPIRDNGNNNNNNNSEDIGSNVRGIKSISSPLFRRQTSRSLGEPQQSNPHTSGSTNYKFPQEGTIGNSTNRVQIKSSSNYVTKLMFANKDVLSIIPILRQQTREGFPLCALAMEEFDDLELRNLEHAIANGLAPEIKNNFRAYGYKYANLLGSVANRGQDLPDDLEKSAIGIMTLFATKSCMNFVNESFTPDKMNPLNKCLAWLGGHMVYSALLQAGTDSSVLTPQMSREFLAQNSTMFDALGACNTGNDIDPKHPDKKVRKKADPKGNKFETIETQLEEIAGGELCGLTGDDRMKFWKFFALLFMAWRGQYYYVKSGGKQYTLVEASFTAANFCQDNPDRNVLENQYIKILTLTHTQAQMYMMPNRTTYPPPVVVKVDRHFQILLDKLHGKLLPDGETRVVASGMTTYFQQRAKLLTRDGNEDPTAEAWRVYHEDESKLTSEQRALLEEDYSYQTAMAWKDAKLYKFDLSKLSDERRAILENNIPYKTMKAWEDLYLHKFDLSKLSIEYRAILEKNPIFLKCAARRLLPECGVLKFGIQDGTIGITFEKPLDSFVCTVKEVENKPSPFRVGDIILSLNDTLLFDKDRKTIGQLIRNSTKRSVIIIRSPELVQNQIKGDESLQCLIQVKTLFSEVDQQSLPSIQQFVKKAEAIFACGKGSPDGAVRSKNGYTNDQLASNNRSDRWTTFLETVDDPLKSLIKEARQNFYIQRRLSAETKELHAQQHDNTIPEELDLITANNTTGYKGVSPKSSVSGTRYAASYRFNGKPRCLGTFDTPVEAARAYAQAHLFQSTQRQDTSTTTGKKKRKDAKEGAKSKDAKRQK